MKIKKNKQFFSQQRTSTIIISNSLHETKFEIVKSYTVENWYEHGEKKIAFYKKKKKKVNVFYT